MNTSTNIWNPYNKTKDWEHEKNCVIFKYQHHNVYNNCKSHTSAGFHNGIITLQRNVSHQPLFSDVANIWQDTNMLLTCLHNINGAILSLLDSSLFQYFELVLVVSLLILHNYLIINSIFTSFSLNNIISISVSK